MRKEKFRWLAWLITGSLTVTMAMPAYAADGMEAAEKAVTETAEEAATETAEPAEEAVPEAAAEAAAEAEGDETPEYEAPMSFTEGKDPLMDSIPVSYNAVIQDPGVITPVKNQFGNTCFAHGFSFAAEADILKNRVLPWATNKNLDLSERVMVFYINGGVKYKDDPLDPLGNCDGKHSSNILSPDYPVTSSFGSGRDISTVYYYNWLGPVNELNEDGSKIPETHVDYMGKEGTDDIPFEYVDPRGGHVIAHLENARFINPEDRDTIKKYIIRNGGVDCSYNVGEDPSYVGSDNKSIYCFDKEPANHEVSLVGWDDDYDRTKFDCDKTKLPEQNGAWLLRNTWGTDSGDKGYYWMSYEDKSLTAITALDMAPADNYDNNYHYLSTVLDNKKYPGGVLAASVYETKKAGGEDQLLKAVGIGVGSADVKYEIQVYKGDFEQLKKDPDKGTCIATAKGQLGCAGVYTIPLDKPAALKAGEGFAVLVCYSRDDGSDIEILGESQTDGKFELNQKAGETLILDSDNTWKDISDKEKNGVYSTTLEIRAFTDRADEDRLEVTGVTNVTGGEVSMNKTTGDITAGFSSSAAQGESIADNADTTFGLTYNREASGIELKSSDERVVAVNENDGKLTAKGPGRAIVRVYENGTQTGYFNVKVIKEIKPEWFSYIQDGIDGSEYSPGSNGITLYENLKCGEAGSWTNIGMGDPDHRLVPADAYYLEYTGNNTVGNASARIVATKESSYCTGANDTISYTIEKLNVKSLYFSVNNGTYDSDNNKYDYEYNKKKIVPEIEKLYVIGNSTGIPYELKGYKTYDLTAKKPGEKYVDPVDAGDYCAVCKVDDKLFTNGTDSFNGEKYLLFSITPVSISDRICDYSSRVSYTGKPVTPMVSVYKMSDGFKVYVPNTDYDVVYHNNTDVYDLTDKDMTDTEVLDKAPYFTVTGKGSHMGNIINNEIQTDGYKDRFYFSIMPLDLTGTDSRGEALTRVTLSADSFAYSGDLITPVVEEVSFNGVKLTEDKDYTISCTKNRYPGTGSVIISGKGIYGGDVYADFTILQPDAAAQEVSVELKNKKAAGSVYTGKAVRPEVKVVLDGRKLKKTEYRAEYYSMNDLAVTDPVNAGEYGIVIRPAEGSAVKFKINSSLVYSIKPKSVKSLKVTLSSNKITQGSGETDEQYIKRVSEGICPGVKSVMDGKTLIKAEDYTVSYSNNHDCGTATAVLSFCGNYSGIKEVPFAIKGKPVSKLRISKIGPQEIAFDPSGEIGRVEPEISVSDAKGNTVSSNDYQVFYCNNSAVGKATALVVGKGIYEGTKQLSFKITPRKLRDKDIILSTGKNNRIESQYYDGAPVMLEDLKVTEANAYSEEDQPRDYELKKDVDYTVKITGSTKPGTGKVTIKGKGIYAGSITSTFIIIDSRRRADNPTDLKSVEKNIQVSLDGTGVDNIFEKGYSVPYSGKEITFDIDLSESIPGGKGGAEETHMMREGYDYRVSYENNKEASADVSGNHINGRRQPKVIITGMAPNYTGTLTINLEIRQLELSFESIKPLWNDRDPFAPAGYAGDAGYTGGTLKPVPRLYYLKDGYEKAVYKGKKTPLLDNSLFRISYENTSGLGSSGAEKAPVMILEPKNSENFDLKGGKPELRYKFSITAGNLADAKIAAVPMQRYKGIAVKPKPAVTLNGVKLKEGLDFEYVYTNNGGPGQANVSIAPIAGSREFTLSGSAPFAEFLIR